MTQHVPGDAPTRSARLGASPAQWAIPVIAGVGLAALATWNSAHKSMWIDEAYTEYTTRLSFGATVHRALHYELQAPGYFALVNLWRHLDSSVMFARALSTIAAVVFVLVMGAAARRAGIAKWGWVSVGAACMPGVVWAAAELRGYALVLLLVALTLYFYLGIVSANEQLARSDAVGYVLASVALLYVFYYGGFVLLGEWLGAIVLRRRAVPLTALLALVALAVLPLVPVIASQVAVHPVDVPNLHLVQRPRYALWKTTGTIVQGFATANATVLSWPHALLVVVLVAVGLPVVRTLTPLVPWDRAEASLVVVAAVPVMVLGLLRLLDITLVEPRHALIAVPGVILVVGRWLERVRDGIARAGLATAVAVLIVAGLAGFERYDLQREDWRGAALYVAARAQPGDVVLVYDPDRTLPFDDYFGPRAHGIPVYGVPVDMNFTRYDPDAYAIDDTAIVGRRVREVAGRAPAIWFVSSRQLLERLARGPAMVDRYLHAHYSVDTPVVMPGVRIEHARPR